MVISYKNLTVFFVFTISLTVFSQIPNPGFEQWSAGNPDNWFTSNLPPFGVPITQVSPGRSGSWAARGEVITITTGDTLIPLLSAGIAGGGFPVTEKYTQLNGYYKFSPIGDDIILIGVLMYKGNISVGSGTNLISALATNFTTFSVPISYNSGEIPDKCIIQIAITNSNPIFHPGSYFIMDDLSLSNPTTIGDQSLASIPEAYEMFQNYPNPFNPVTHIRYGIPTASEVNIEVYNSLGQRVAVLENDYQTAGYHVVDFDAARFPSGIYFYRIDAGSFHKMMKMILMK
jgi:hypothetical protein